MKDRDKGIAVFDSGVGGLTVFREIRRELPAERLVYFGDMARVPYGSKTREAVTRFSLEIARFLVGRGVKMLVVACNSASALALPDIEEAVEVPVLGVIRPAVRAAAAASPSGRIGVVGTEATIRSGAYQRALSEEGRGLEASVQACPLLVPLVEEGWWAHRVTRLVAAEYLAPLRRAGIDTLILGCTHYPLIRGVLQEAAGKRVGLIDSATATALEVRSRLEAGGLLRRRGGGKEEFFVSDARERFQRLAQAILGGRRMRVELVRVEA
jgi:glutamate racemase